MITPEQTNCTPKDDSQQSSDCPRYRSHLESIWFGGGIVDERVETDEGDVESEETGVNQELEKEFVVCVTLHDHKSLNTLRTVS